jgi:uncharacterized membrane protein
MASLGRAALLHGILIGLLAVQLVVYYPRLPDRVASHFGPAGEADGWMDKQGLAIVSILSPIALAGIMIGVQALIIFMDRIPGSMINMPNKKYWLAPERRAETMAWMVPVMARYTLWLGVGVNALLVVIAGMALRANLTPDPRLTYAMPVVLIFLALVTIASIHLLVRVYRKFGRTPSAG